MKLFITTICIIFLLSDPLGISKILAYQVASEESEIGLIKYLDDEYNWGVSYPNNWQVTVAFKNESEKGNIKVINKRVIFYTNENELVTVDVWENIDLKDVYEAFQEIESIFIQKKDIPQGINGFISDEPAILAADLNSENQNVMHKSATIYYKKHIYRIVYSIINGKSEHDFNSFLENFSFAKKVNYKTVISELPVFRTNQAYKVYSENNCGPNGEYYLFGNPFPCASACTLTKTNCTWWAIYKRPDLKTKIIFGNAGYSWIEQARQTNVPISNTVVDGSIVVWDGHVAYVNSHMGSNDFNISEMNCNNINYPGPRDANVHTNYSDSFNLYLYGFIGDRNIDIVITNQNITSGTFEAKNSITVLPETVLIPSQDNIALTIN